MAKTATKRQVTENSIKQAHQFESAIVDRRLLHAHELNPRTIDAHAYKRLRDFLKKNSLLANLTINRRTIENGFSPEENGKLVVVGGHQRLRGLDENFGFDPQTGENSYSVPVAIVEVNKAREHEILIGLNNPGMTGTFDLDLLAEVLSTPGLKPFDTGFDRVELGLIFDEGVLASILGETPPAPSAAESSVLSQIEEITSTARPPGYTAERAAESAAHTPTQSASPAGSAPHDYTDELKNRRIDYPETVAQANESDISLTLVANSADELSRFRKLAGVQSGVEYVDLTAVLDGLGIVLP